jgi:hypothetical protein
MILYAYIFSPLRKDKLKMATLHYVTNVKKYETYQVGNSLANKQQQASG